eukprot:1317199-Amphidinium_carterae.2
MSSAQHTRLQSGHPKVDTTNCAVLSSDLQKASQQSSHKRSVPNRCSGLPSRLRLLTSDFQAQVRVILGAKSKKGNDITSYR